MSVSDMPNATFTQVGRSQVGSYCDDKGFPRQQQGQISGRRPAHRLEVKPVLAVRIGSEQSQKHRLGVGGVGGLFSEEQPDGTAP